MGNKVQKQENLVFLIQVGIDKDIIETINKLVKEDPQCINRPLNKGAYSQVGDTALHYSVYRKLPQVVRTLLGLGIDENLRNMRGIIAAELLDEDDLSKEANDIRELLANADSLRKTGVQVPPKPAEVNLSNSEVTGSQTYLSPAQLRAQKEAQASQGGNPAQPPAPGDITQPLPQVVPPPPTSQAENIEKQPDLPNPSQPAFGSNVL